MQPCDIPAVQFIGVSCQEESMAIVLFFWDGYIQWTYGLKGIREKANCIFPREVKAEHRLNK